MPAEEHCLRKRVAACLGAWLWYRDWLYLGLTASRCQAKVAAWRRGYEVSWCSESPSMDLELRFPRLEWPFPALESRFPDLESLSRTWSCP
jgi:hypothetical protein